jgi:clan AA aspartic protease (TIGR02281 family)
MCTADPARSASPDEGMPGGAISIEIAQASTTDALKARAEQGDAAAQNDLGVLYHKGSGVPKNLQEAARLYKLSADQGYAKGQVNLGILNFFGDGVPKNQEESARLFQLAAAKGDGMAQYLLGNCYANGQGMAQNNAEAIRLFKLAADRGQPMAQNDLGRMYELGLGTPRNYIEAARWYRASADRGNAAARQNLARLSSTVNAPPLTSAPQVATAAGPAGNVVEVPLRRSGGTFYVPVTINDTVTVNFVVDSGASDVVIPHDIVEQLKQSGTLGPEDLKGSQIYTVANGAKVVSQVLRIRSLRLGSRTVENVKGSESQGKGIALLGQSFLSRFKSWSIDNSRQVLVLSELPR